MRPRSLNPNKAITMAIYLIIVHFWYLASALDAWRGVWIRVRSKDVQKQLARTSLTHEPFFLSSPPPSFFGDRRIIASLSIVLLYSITYFVDLIKTCRNHGNNIHPHNHTRTLTFCQRIIRSPTHSPTHTPTDPPTPWFTWHCPALTHTLTHMHTRTKPPRSPTPHNIRSEEHTSELQSR